MKQYKPTVKLHSFEEVLQTMGFITYTCTGYSMMPFLRQRLDIVEIRPLKGRAKKYDVVLYKVGNKYILHRVMKVCKNDYVICGDHNYRREYGVTDRQIIGVMTQVIKNGKSVYPSDWKYKLYVHMWCDFFHVRVVILYIGLKARAVGRKVKKWLFGKNIETHEQAE